MEETCIKEKFLDTQCDTYLSHALSYTSPSCIIKHADDHAESKRKWSVTSCIQKNNFSTATGHAYFSDASEVTLHLHVT